MKPAPSKPTVILLLIVIIASFAFAVREYVRIRASQLIASYKTAFVGELAENHGPLGATDATLVNSWMTFDYVDRIFKLPSGYLADALAIANARYPHLVIARYAAAERLDQETFLGKVRQAVAAYFASSSNPQ